jgi:hypothetical protein
MRFREGARRTDAGFLMADPEHTNPSPAEERSGQERRVQAERRAGTDRRVANLPLDGPDRRTGSDRRSVVNRRSGMERRRGPGRRRSDQRRSAEEGEMTDEQFEFIMAIDEYKRVNNRPFPTWTEVLEVIKHLGYRRVVEVGEHIDRRRDVPLACGEQASSGSCLDGVSVGEGQPQA